MIFDKNQVVFYLNKYEFLYSIYIKKNPTDDDGDSALHSAVRSGKFHVSRYMLENLKEKNPRNDNGEAPLHMAAEYSYLKTVLKTKVQETIKNGLHFILLLLLAIRMFASC